MVFTITHAAREFFIAEQDMGSAVNLYYDKHVKDRLLAYFPN